MVFSTKFKEIFLLHSFANNAKFFIQLGTWNINAKKSTYVIGVIAGVAAIIVIGAVAHDDVAIGQHCGQRNTDVGVGISGMRRRRPYDLVKGLNESSAGVCVLVIAGTAVLQRVLALGEELVGLGLQLFWMGGVLSHEGRLEGEQK